MNWKLEAVSLLLVGVLCLALGTVRAQSTSPKAYWVTETLEIADQEAFTKAVRAVAPTVKQYGGRYIVLGGRITADLGPAPKRITIIEFDTFEQAQKWVASPEGTKARAEVFKHAKARNYTVEGRPELPGHARAD